MRGLLGWMFGLKYSTGRGFDLDTVGVLESSFFIKVVILMRVFTEKHIIELIKKYGNVRKSGEKKNERVDRKTHN